jgi:hypothetical protein
MSETLRKREPMNQLLAQWAKDQREIFEAMGISNASAYVVVNYASHQWNFTADTLE